MSEAPKLKNVMPNSWKKVTRLTAEEEQEFIQKNPDIIEQRIERMYYSSARNRPFENPTPRIYKQIVGSDIFYRIIITSNFVQMLVYKMNERNKIIAITEYNKFLVAEKTYSSIGFYSVEIIESEGKAKGILISETRTYIENRQVVKGQLAGNCRVMYFLMDDILQTEDFHKPFYPDNIGKDILKE